MMIAGYATPEGTAYHAAQFSELAFNTLGKTGLQCSAAGFGGYRIAAGVQDHGAALRSALAHGINLIDTSANYTDGESERLIGQILTSLIDSGEVDRDRVIVVSKAGYLQGANYALSQQRKADGRGFADLVEYADGLEHCIHPEFLDDQLTRTLERLNLETLDVYLLHNPEYYLGWAAKSGIDRQTAQDEFYRRIALAFDFMETAVNDGRIKAYGISANTFVAPADDAEFVSLEQVWQLAETASMKNHGIHHFGVVQFPMNVFEPGAVIEPNQSDGGSVLDIVRQRQLGCLVNRPLNAFRGGRLVRLAEVEDPGRYADDDITRAIGHLNRSEKRLWYRLLPRMNLPVPLYNRIKEQIGVADQLKHYWRNFGSYERWRQVRDGVFVPRVQGVMDYCRQQEASMDDLRQWTDDHGPLLKAALRAVGSLYAGQARKQNDILKQHIRQADPDWGTVDTLSQMAVRAVRSTAGIACVLVGMRTPAYVKDVRRELTRPIDPSDRRANWAALADLLKP